MDALTDWEHGLGHVATAGKRGWMFTLTSICRPHPGVTGDTYLKWCDCRESSAFFYYKEGAMALDIAHEAEGLVSQIEELKAQIFAAVGGNVAANRRARKLSVCIRQDIKQLRFKLLQLEKDTVNARCK